MTDMREAVARALAKHDRIEICSDASYALSSYGPKADAALSLMQPEIDRRVAEEKAKLLAGLHRLELAGSAFAQLRSTIAVRFDGLTENSLWFSLNKAFDDLASARAMLAQFEKEQQP